MTPVPPDEHTPANSSLFQLSGFRAPGEKVPDLKVSGNVYLAEHRKDSVTVYRLLRTQESAGGTRMVESIVLEPKQHQMR